MKNITLKQKSKILKINLDKNKILKEKILDELTLSPQGINTVKIRKNHNLIDEMFKYYNYITDDVISVINAIFRDYSEFPRCRKCHKPLKTTTITSDFKIHCSNYCYNKDIEYHKIQDKNKLHANEKNYKEICYKLIENYELEFKKKFPKKYKNRFLNAQLKRVKEGKSLISCKKYLSTIYNNFTERARLSSMENLKIMNAKNRENLTQNQINARKNNMKIANNHPNTKKARKKSIKKMQKWIKENEEFYHKILVKNGKINGPKTISIARKVLNEKIQRGEIEFYKSKEEINCRKELEKKLKIKFDYKINNKKEKNI